MVLLDERLKVSGSLFPLRCDYRPEHLFTLRQSVAAYRSYQKLIDECDREIRQRLHDFQPPHPAAETPKEEKCTNKIRSSDSVLTSELQRVFGIDLTRIPGIRTGIAQTLFGEIGPDFTPFRSASALSVPSASGGPSNCAKSTNPARIRGRSLS